MDELPETVRTAMKLKDYDNKGHPLTVRRITAVKAAIRKFTDSVTYFSLYLLIPSVRDALGGGEFTPLATSLPDNVAADQRRSVYAMVKDIVQSEEAQPGILPA